ncbi:MAG: tetratricopeptide repeat protein [Bacteroidia bacterium]
MRKISFYFPLFIFLGFQACSSGPTGQTDPDQIAEKVYPEYVGELSKQIAEKPEDASLYYRRAEKLFQEGEDTLAYADIKEAVRLRDNDATYYLLYGNIAYGMNDISDAQTAIKRAIELKPDYKEAYLRLARMHYDLKDFENANKMLEKLSKAVGELPESYFLFGMIKKELSDTSSSIANFQKAVALNNDYYDAYMQLGLLLGAQENKLGIDYLNNAIRLKGNSTEALYARGKLYQDLGYYKQAVEDYDRIITINPDYAAAYYNVGWINFRVEKFEPAIEYFNKAIIADETYADAYYMRGLSYQAIGNNTEAKRNYEACLKVNPAHKRAKEMLGGI